MANELPHDHTLEHLVELSRVLQTVEERLGRLGGESAALMRRSVQSALRYAPPLPAPDAQDLES